MRTVRRATELDVPAMAAALARAYFDDPLVSWWLPDAPSRLNRSAVLFAGSLRKLALPHGEVYTTDDLAGAASWFPPGGWKTSFVASVPALPATVAALRSGSRRFFRSIAALESRHPTEPHWYLEGLATDPVHQRRGVGTALVAPVLDRCDRERLPAYLETQKERNVGYYQRLGFALTGEMDLPDGGPHMWLMWRPPRP